MVKIGDYVFATQYKHGSYWQLWAVGFVEEVLRTKKGTFYTVVDADGNPFHSRFLFTRVKKIDKDTGHFLIRNKENLGQNLYWTVKNWKLLTFLNVKDEEA